MYFNLCSKGWRQHININQDSTLLCVSFSDVLPDGVQAVLENATKLVMSKSFDSSNLRYCCRNIITLFANDDVVKAMCYKQGSQHCKLITKNRSIKLKVFFILQRYLPGQK